MAEHTPGPWTANSDGQIQCEKLNQYGNWIVAAIQRELTDEDRANAALLASAPDLLAVCEKLAARGAVVATTGLGDELEAAIAKAKGGDSC